MCKLIHILSLSLLCISTHLLAQDFSKQWQYIESINEESNTEDLLDVWEYYFQNPINLSNPSQLQLLTELHLLNIKELNLIRVFCTNNKINSIYQLQILDINIASLRRIKPFITNNKSQNNSKLVRKSTYYTGAQFQIPKREGVLNNNYIGSALKNHFRFRTVITNSWRLGFSIEKDIGEPLKYNGKGFNNIAFNLNYVGLKKLQQLSVGKYDISIAEGLLFGTGYRINSPYFLSYNPGKITKSSLSPKEYKYFEGFTAKWKFKQLIVNLFSSIRKPHGTTSYDETGLFRTKNEILKLKNHTEQLIGIHLQKELIQSRFSWAGIIYKSDLLEKRNLVLQSFYFKKNYYNIQLSSEIVNQDLKDWAGILKLNISIGDNSFITLQTRNRNSGMLNEFNADYSSFSNGYEKGVYYAFQHKMNKNWFFKLAFDSFKSTQIQNNTPHYPAGNKMFSELVRSTESTKLVYQYQFKKIIESSSIQKHKLYYQLQINTQLRWTSKLYYITESKQPNSSLQLNLYWTSKSKQEKLSYSNSYFNTKNEAIYWQAPHFYGTYNARFLSGKGNVFSLSFQKRIQGNFKLGIQVIVLNYADRKVIGSGNETINNPTKLDFALYLKWKTVN